MQEESGPDPPFEFSACETAICPFPVAVGAVKGAFAGAARPLVRPGAQLSRLGGRTQGPRRTRRGAAPGAGAASAACAGEPGKQPAALGRGSGRRAGPETGHAAGTRSLGSGWERESPAAGNRVDASSHVHCFHFPPAPAVIARDAPNPPRPTSAFYSHGTAPLPRLRRAGGALPNPAGGGPSRHRRHAEAWLRRPRPLGGRRGPAGQKAGGWVSARLARRGLQANWSRLRSASRPWVRL